MDLRYYQWNAILPKPVLPKSRKYQAKDLLLLHSWIFFFGMPLPPTPKFNSSAYCSQMNASYTLSSSCCSSPIPQYLQYLLNSLLSLSYMHTKFISPSKSSFTVLPLIQCLFFFIYLKLTYPSSPFSQSFPWLYQLSLISLFSEILWFIIRSNTVVSLLPTSHPHPLQSTINNSLQTRINLLCFMFIWTKTPWRQDCSFVSPKGPCRK